MADYQNKTTMSPKDRLLPIELSANLHKGDNPKTKQRLQRIKTVIERPKTVAIVPAIRGKKLKQDQAYDYILAHSKEAWIQAIQKVDESYEITFKNTEFKQKFMERSKLLRIGDVNINIMKPREATIWKKEATTDVYIYEFPPEESDKHLRQKMAKYGDIVVIQRINKKGTTISTGVRCIKYRRIEQEIPTMLYCRGLQIKTRHIGQDRSPTCSICKKKGHYRTACDMEKTEEERRKKKEADDKKKMEEHIRLDMERRKKNEEPRRKNEEDAHNQQPCLKSMTFSELRATLVFPAGKPPPFYEWRKLQNEEVNSRFRKEELRSMYRDEAGEWWREESERTIASKRRRMDTDEPD